MSTPQNCRQCGEPFEPADRYAYECPSCLIAEDQRRFEERREENRKTAREKLAEILPPRMLQTDRNDPRFNAKLWAAVKDWKPTVDRPWLGLIGPTGKCKSRIAHEILADAVLGAAEVKNPRRLTPAVVANFGHKITWSFASIAATKYADMVRRPIDDDALAVKDNAEASRWLVMDDMGKSTHTKAVSSALFGLFDHRGAYILPTIWTANSRPESFLADMDKDIADPLRGRLLEFSTLVEIR
jgi:DNA replication protein DnaC